MEVSVVKHTEIDPSDVGHIDHIFLTYQSADVIILDVQLHTRGKEVCAHTSGDGHMSFWIGSDEVLVKLPKSFADCLVFSSQTSKYTTHVVFYRTRLLDAFLEGNGQVRGMLWSDP